MKEIVIIILVWVLRLVFTGATLYFLWQDVLVNGISPYVFLETRASMFRDGMIFLLIVPWAIKFANNTRDGIAEVARHAHREFIRMIWETEKYTARERAELITRQDAFLRRLPKWAQRRLKAAKQEKVKG